MSQSSPRKFPRLAGDTPIAANETDARLERASPSVEPNPYLAGEVIGDRYRLVRELGRGGMGVVWVGYALALGVEVAVKLIRASTASPAVSSRMAREAHAAARLGHPALVRVFDFGWTSRGDPYLVMELVQGETLNACMEREGRISAIRAVQMLLPIVDGLRLAHDRTIVHRDIKPDNIFLATDPLGRIQPKLLDFGIAKVGPGNVDARLTQVGVVLGSPEYMSPEQATGVEDVDERTDVWSLSIVLYEMVTSTVPFKRPNYNALMQAIIHESPKPMTEYAEGDESLWKVVERGLAKDRDLRWSSMAELGEALALWLYEHGIKEDICGNSIRAVWLDGLSVGAKIETFPTLRPLQRPTDARLAKHSASARTVEGVRYRERILGVNDGRVRRVALSAIVFTALLGGVGAGFLLRGSSEKNETLLSSATLVPPPTSAGEVALPSAGHVSSKLGGAAIPTEPKPSAEAGVPVENLTKETDYAQNGNASSAKSRTNGTVTSVKKPGTKGTKRRHDFGF
jgi:serine/threonine-protein kinase